MAGYTKWEWKIVRMVEERGVAGLPFNRDVNELVKYVEEQFKGLRTGRYGDSTVPIEGKNYRCDWFKILIPDRITSRFTWFSKLNMVVSIADVTGVPEEQRVTRNSGSVELTDHEELVDGKLKETNLNIRGIAYDGALKTQGLHSSIYHEFNHAYETYDALRRGGEGYEKRVDKRNYTAVTTAMKVDNPDTEIRDFCTIMYRLHENGELNALVASVYGDLQGMNATRRSYNSDLQKTKAWQLYDEIKNRLLPSLEKVDAAKWGKFKPYFRDIKETSDLGVFKRKFIAITNTKLKDLFKRIGRVASQWYDDCPKSVCEAIKLTNPDMEAWDAQFGEETHSFKNKGNGGLEVIIDMMYNRLPKVGE